MFKKLLFIGLVLALCMVLPAVARVAEGTCDGPIVEEQATALAVISANDFVTQGDFVKAADLIAGGGNLMSAMDVGDVLVDLNCDAGTLSVKYVIVDATPDDPFDNWYLTETHLQVADSLLGIPQAKGNPVPGRFEYSMHHDYVTEYIYTVDISDSPCDGTLIVAAHAVVKDPCGLDGLELALPATVTVVVDYYDAGEPTYFDISLGDDGFLNGAYDAWCVDVGHYIYEGYVYTGTNVYSSYEELPPTITIDNPENFDRVNWIINHIAYGDTLTDQYGIPIPGTVTMCDIQRAIWTLIDDQIADCGDYSQPRVNEIVRQANLYGDGYTPGCNDKLAIVLVPLHTDGVPDDPPYNPPQVIIAQVIIGQGSVPCDMCRSETAWGAVPGMVVVEKGKSLPGYQFPGKDWATYFDIPCCGVD
jgi:hypothetical protein